MLKTFSFPFKQEVCNSQSKPRVKRHQLLPAPTWRKAHSDRLTCGAMFLCEGTVTGGHGRGGRRSRFPQVHSLELNQVDAPQIDV
ncbi:hypothetical protein J6590_057388 [Homalodisca vitripennis]|nr:hypothetical protein J6590_057388 [Homalodisca vitripennis]